jgi:hypothetical protein
VSDCIASSLKERIFWTGERKLVENDEGQRASRKIDALEEGLRGKNASGLVRQELLDQTLSGHLKRRHDRKIHPLT